MIIDTLQMLSILFILVVFLYQLEWVRKHGEIHDLLLKSFDIFDEKHKEILKKMEGRDR